MKSLSHNRARIRPNKSTKKRATKGPGQRAARGPEDFYQGRPRPALFCCLGQPDVDFTSSIAWVLTRPRLEPENSGEHTIQAVSVRPQILTPDPFKVKPVTAITGLYRAGSLPAGKGGYTRAGIHGDLGTKGH